MLREEGLGNIIWYLCLKNFILFCSAEKRLEGGEAQSGKLARGLWQ